MWQRKINDNCYFILKCRSNVTVKVINETFGNNFFFFMGGPVSVLDGHVKETYEMSIALGARP